MTHILLPFMILSLYSVMKSIPPTYQRAAISLGLFSFIRSPHSGACMCRRPYPGIGAPARCSSSFWRRLLHHARAARRPETTEMVGYYVAYFANVTINWGMACALGALATCRDAGAVRDL